VQGEGEWPVFKAQGSGLHTQQSICSVGRWSRHKHSDFQRAVTVFVILDVGTVLVFGEALRVELARRASMRKDRKDLYMRCSIPSAACERAKEP
jgi:hypothetical protein